MPIVSPPHLPFALSTLPLAPPTPSLQLTAATSLIALVDDWSFSDAQFGECVGPMLHLVTAALPDLHEMDSHTHLFHLMNLVVERMGEGIKPHVPPLLQVWCMPDLNLLRAHARALTLSGRARSWDSSIRGNALYPTHPAAVVHPAALHSPHRDLQPQHCL